MAKVSMIVKNERIIKTVERCSKKREALKAEIKNKKISLEERFKLQIQLNKMPWSSSKKRIRNRCEITGKPRGYFRKFGLCRNKLRELAAEGLVAGLRKSSW
jgi:small subunit ribosomal protein S14